MTWRPATEQHAIERVRIALTFDRPLPHRKIRGLGASLGDRLPSLGFGPIMVQAGPSISIQMGPNGPVAVPQDPQDSAGWTFQRTNSRGLAVEAIQLVENMLTYESMEYSRWPSFFERFRNVASEVAGELLSLEDPASLTLEYQDLFWFEGPPTSARPSELLRIAAEVVPAAALDGQNLWHVHRGWFEEGRRGGDDFGRLLLRHNLDASDGAMRNQQRRIVRMNTLAEGRRGFWTIAGDDLQPHLDIMHARTKEVFSEALTDEVCRRIGIVREDS